MAPKTRAQSAAGAEGRSDTGDPSSKPIAVSPSAFMAPPNPKRSKSNQHQHEINPSQQNHQQREEYPVPQKSKPSAGWADLPKDLVEAILMSLPLEDYSPFGSTCKPWWSAMINVRALFKPPPVLILKPGRLEDPRVLAREAEATRFYAICRGGERGRRRLPMIRPNPAARCCGSSMGWLLMLDVNDGSRAHLLNPVSGERAELPALPLHVTLSSWDEVVCSTPAPDQDCVVAVQGTTIGRNFRGRYFRTVLLTCRPKDDQWIEIPHEWRGTHYYQRWVQTFALYEARLYVISGRRRMDIYDLDPDRTKIGSVIFDDGIWDISAQKILAVVDGKLLLVCGVIHGLRHLFELVGNRWVKIQSLGEWVLLMHQFTSQAFSTKESPTLGFRANCIYQEAHYAMTVYSMEDECFSNACFHRAIHSAMPGAWFKIYWFLAQSW